MSVMTSTVGVNLSASPRDTTLVLVEWQKGKAHIATVLVGLDDDELMGYLLSEDWIGVCAPFGWPLAMTQAVASYANQGRWHRSSKGEFQYRATDNFVHEVLQAESGRELWPPSVSCAQLALQARRVAQLREHLFMETGARFDRSGNDRVIEVYPPGAAVIWGLDSAPAEKVPTTPQNSESTAVDPMDARVPWLSRSSGSERCIKHKATREALLAALVARAAALGLTMRPGSEHMDSAQREGWIHLPGKATLHRLVHAG